MPTDHKRDHDQIAEAIKGDWLARERLLVHLAREHGFTVSDVDNAGLAVLIVQHDDAHGAPCFTEAEKAGPSDGLRQGLRHLREGA
ncbi:hypothetical protein ACFOY4_09915 [Actinomadura syzygii]|uniref:Uncharacterized protein n=1 Tax=Actinomadura syzygii TaxID=1427538 RepID=A0A5D0UDJ7_9ACTN|nr:hypothetical protein [Actinomadura syzygii]TYC15870.1 hypothetical protein FXF65_11040 [Actinomadura syzygii]